MPEFLRFRKHVSSPFLLKESSTHIKNDVVVTGFNEIAVLLLTKVSFFKFVNMVLRKLLFNLRDCLGVSWVY